VRALWDLAIKYAAVDSPVLLLGESPRTLPGKA
jgi:hypothetical protein